MPAADRQEPVEPMLEPTSRQVDLDEVVKEEDTNVRPFGASTESSPSSLSELPILLDSIAGVLNQYATMVTREIEGATQDPEVIQRLVQEVLGQIGEVAFLHARDGKSPTDLAREFTDEIVMAHIKGALRRHFSKVRRERKRNVSLDQRSYLADTRPLPSFEEQAVERLDIVDAFHSCKLEEQYMLVWKHKYFLHLFLASLGNLTSFARFTGRSYDSVAQRIHRAAASFKDHYRSEKTDRDQTD